MSGLLAIVERGKDNLLLVEEYLAAERRREPARGRRSARGRRRSLARRWTSSQRSSCLRSGVWASV